MTHHVVVLGGGGAGLPAAKRLARQVRREEVTVTLVLASPDFVERPRLPRIATGQRIPVTPVEEYLGGSGVRLVIGSVTGLDPAVRKVVVARGGQARSLSYDTLVHAQGSTVDDEGVPGAAECAWSLTDPGEAARVGAVLREMTVAGGGGRVVVCGAGPTGIEIAGEVAERFPALGVALVGGSRLDGRMSPKARSYVQRALGDLGVAVRTGALVRRVEAGGLVLDTGERVPFDLCLWAGGYRVPALARASGLAVDDRGRALVDATLQSVSHPGVYVIGDAAAVPGRRGPELPTGRPAGGSAGPQVADIIAARLAGREPRPFRPRRVHECVSVGRRRGFVQFLDADERPTGRVLTGRKAVVFQNATLGGARLLLRHSGPFLARRRPLAPAADAPADATAGNPANGPRP
ncbi:NAD(P)/FAD-dependent oxidoreductase [Streptomyces sp. HPF1205]|uniref:NAD(P)/FAD-dependent oxidoreductase n=1 Tax=Streptomyces sp. HPF1205 TaxID=2873262 RepID=UPI001CEC7AFB|nr:FAD-dependent oxidoreductase [Streptomyces sp. HPF1205]